MVYKLNGDVLRMDIAFTANSVNYPPHWLRNATSDEQAAVGITWENPVYNNVDPRFFNPDGSDKDLASAKSLWIKVQKDEANELLADTDWYVLRAAEGGTAVPSATTTLRGNIRTKCKEREDQITACSNMTALASLLQANLTIDGTASNGATEKKKADGSSYDPKQWNPDAPNPGALKAWPNS